MLNDKVANLLGARATAERGESNTEARLQHGIRRMGVPSWWILEALAVGPTDGMPAFEIIRAVDSALRHAGYPAQLGAATAHHALERLEEDGFLERSAREVEVPVGHGATRREQRAVWSVTGLGALAHDRHRALQRAFSLQLRRGGAGA